MKDQLISFAVAEVAKKKDFDEEVSNYFQIGIISEGLQEHGLDKPQKITSMFPNQALWARPTQSLLQKWLREIHDIDITILVDYFPHNVKRYISVVWEGKENKSYPASAKFSTYENALEEALLQSLMLIP